MLVHAPEGAEGELDVQEARTGIRSGIARELRLAERCGGACGGACSGGVVAPASKLSVPRPLGPTQVSSRLSKKVARLFAT